MRPALVLLLRRAVVWLTLACFVTTQTVAQTGPHAEGTAAGQAANPVIRGTINAPDASAVVPGYTTTPPERGYYGQPNLSGQTSARLAACSGRARAWGAGAPPAGGADGADGAGAGAGDGRCSTGGRGAVPQAASSSAASRGIRPRARAGREAENMDGVHSRLAIVSRPSIPSATPARTHQRSAPCG